MRTDLTAAFETAKDADTRKPRQLAVFHFPTAGDVYISDQALGVADGLDNEYAALVEDWGELIDMAGGDPMDQRAGEIRQLSMTIWNGGAIPFSNYFLKEDPENVLVDVYQWFDGLADSDKVLIDTFVIQDPIEFDEASRLLRLDFVSLSMRYDNPIGDLLNAGDWPNAKIADLGKGIDLPIGSPGEVKTLVAKTAPKATLNGSILAASMTINVNEDLDELGFSASGTLQIGEEKIRYSSRSGSAFTVVQRAYLSTASEHLDTGEVTEFITDHTFLAGKGPVSAISAVKVAGFPAPAGIYTAYPALDPARIVFSEKPYSRQYAKGSTFLEMQFDAVNGDNTAWQPHLAYDEAAAASAAKISQSYRKLSLRQVNSNPNRGEIVRAYLAVEHWESGVFLSDYCEVSIPGIGVLGRLSRPNPADISDIEAEVDIDHGHSHVIGGDHVHYFNDPSLVTDNEDHGHPSTGISSTTRHVSDLAADFRIHSNGMYYKIVRFPTFPASYDYAVVTIRSSHSLYAIFKCKPAEGFYGGNVQVGSGERQVVITSGDWIYLTVASTTNLWPADVLILQVYADVTSDSAVEPAPSQASTRIADPSEVRNNVEPVKAGDDVDSLATDNVSIDILANDAATRSIVNLFDVTAHVDFAWSWFTNQDISVEYKGSNDAKDVYILHVFFDIEYRKKEVVFSDEVTCEVTGLIDDASGTYTGTPNALITRPDHVRKYILYHRGGLGTGYIDTASFAAAGTLFASLGYAFSGVLDANLTVREVEKKLARQCRSRFFWNAGKAKISLRQTLAELSIDRYITASDTRLKSISVQRQRTTDLVNTIELFYDRDWVSGQGGSKDYQASVRDSDATSISQHGVCEKRDGFLFDLVTNQAMAEDLRDFYLEQGKYLSSFYTLEAYLKQFDVEKEDCVALTSSFNQLQKARMVVRAADRVFGSGKLKRINLIRIVAECLRYLMIEHSIADTVAVMDALSVELGLELNLEDIIHVREDLTAAMGLAESETVTVSDVLAAVIDFNVSDPLTITVSETLAIAINVLIEDTVVLADLYESWRVHGFGGGGFGDSGFGGFVVWRNQDPDQITATDVLTVSQSAAFSDTVSASEALYFSDGFGGPNFGGFGQAPFGS